MKILLGNDDGIMAKGLEVFYYLLVGLGHEVNVAAPEYCHSGASHALTLGSPLMPKKVYKNGDFFGMAVNGYPADAVRLGVKIIYPDVDLVVTGINLGNNAGPAIYYSGTVASAFEGMVAGKPSLAFSFNSFNEKDFDGLDKKLQPFLPQLLELAAKDVLYNINIPCASEIKGLRITRQFMGKFADRYQKRVNPRERDYYWLDHMDYQQEQPIRREDANASLPDDLTTMRQGYISITPLQFDLTDYRCLKTLKL